MVRLLPICWYFLLNACFKVATSVNVIQVIPSMYSKFVQKKINEANDTLMPEQNVEYLVAILMYFAEGKF